MDFGKSLFLSFSKNSEITSTILLFGENKDMGVHENNDNNWPYHIIASSGTISGIASGSSHDIFHEETSPFKLQIGDKSELVICNKNN